jgi:hypothetical protein
MIGYIEVGAIAPGGDSDVLPNLRKTGTLAVAEPAPAFVAVPLADAVV